MELATHLTEYSPSELDDILQSLDRRILRLQAERDEIWIEQARRGLA